MMPDTSLLNPPQGVNSTFDRSDARALAARFNLGQLKAELHQAGIKRDISRAHFTDAEAAFWTEYAAAVRAAIELVKESHAPPGKNISRKISAAEIKDRIDIVAVVEQYVQLRKAGDRYIGRCPFHQEKAPSFYIFPETQSFHCFGCQAHGDVFTFIEKIENCDFKQAISILGE